MKLFELFTNLLFEQHQMELLTKKLVGEPQPGDLWDRIPQEDFETILNVTNKKFAYTAWLTKHIVQGHLEIDEVQKFMEYIKVFEKYKTEFPKSDINQYKTLEDMRTFVSTVKKVESEIGEKEKHGGEKNFISPSKVRKLDSEFGIKLIGINDGYQVFQVPMSLSGNEEGWTAYRNTLGQCSGEKNSMCTFATKTHFDSYLESGPLYVIYNLSDPMSPYQISFEKVEFNNRDNKPVI